MTTAEIKVGFQFKLIETGRTYEVTKISDASVWFRDVTRTPVWRQSKNTFINKLKMGYLAIN